MPVTQGMHHMLNAYRTPSLQTVLPQYIQTAKGIEDVKRPSFLRWIHNSCNMNKKKHLIKCQLLNFAS